ncbi:HNH endonuclease [Bacillus sp. JJ1562]|uniref:HNH endonuclease n=1 Tax=Bacillus sp. JJ1562 TaxID=3122960 RepID=UPI003002F78A
METKICRICGLEKELSLFEIDSRVKNKITNRCRECKHELDDKASRAFRRLRRRSADLNIPMEVSVREIRLIFQMFDGRCAYCNKRPEQPKHLHLEHIQPLSEGGRNTLANLIPACIHDNASKGTKPIVTYFLENRDKFPDENFALVISYISLLTNSKKEDVVADLTNEHVGFELRQAFEGIGK